jgi:hypothetical protein
MNNTIVGHTLYSWQSDLIQLYDKTPRGSVIVCKSARQRGKSFALMNLLLKETINKPKFKAVVVVPSYQLARKQYKELIDLIGNIPKLIKSANSTFFDIEFYNGSVIKYKSAESRDNLRGESGVHLLCCDEAAFVDLETFTTCCLPYVQTKQGKILCISTPRFKSDTCLFYRYWSAGKEGKKGIYTFDFCDYDTSCMLSKEQEQMFKETMTPSTFRNEILGEFLEQQSDLFNLEPILKNNTLSGEYLVMGVDFSSGVGGDYTVLSLFNNERQMYKMFRFNDKTPSETIDIIINVLKEYPIKKAVFEKNSIGAVYLSELRKKVAKNNIRTQIIEFQTTNTSKRQIIEDLILAVQNQTITILDLFDIKNELLALEMKQTPSGLITYSGGGNTHDDICISISLALYGLKQGQYQIR